MPFNLQEYAFASFQPRLAWDIEHCENITEDTYNVQVSGQFINQYNSILTLIKLGAWNPLDDWLWLEKPCLVEVLEGIGPIRVDDFRVINDFNETKTVNFKFSSMGRKTCITLDWDDGTGWVWQKNKPFEIFSFQTSILWKCPKLQNKVNFQKFRFEVTRPVFSGFPISQS